MWKRVFGGLIAAAIVGGALAGSKKTDPDTLARVGEVVGAKVKTALPDSSAVSGPLVAFRPGDVLPVEEKVRLRIRTDKAMDGADVTVAAGSAAGEVRLRGVVRNPDQAQRAVRLAEGTVGVEKVVNELAVPER
jgi:hypothetical protein